MSGGAAKNDCPLYRVRCRHAPCRHRFVRIRGSCVRASTERFTHRAVANLRRRHPRAQGAGRNRRACRRAVRQDRETVSGAGRRPRSALRELPRPTSRSAGARHDDPVEFPSPRRSLGRRRNTRSGKRRRVPRDPALARRRRQAGCPRLYRHPAARPQPGVDTRKPVTAVRICYHPQPDSTPRKFTMKLRALWLPGALLLSANAFATTWTVTNTADTAGSCSSSCTLRAAINSAGAGDTITFANAINGSTIALTLSSNDTSVGSTEFGPSAFFLTNGAALTIDGSGHGITIARLATQPAFRLFDIDANSSLTLKGLTLRNGLARGGSSYGGGGALGAGGAIFNQGTLAMGNCTLAQNAAQGGSGGVGTGSASGGAGVGGDVAGVDGSGPNGAPAGAPPRNAGFGGGGGTAQGTNEPGGNGGFGGGGGNGTAAGGSGGFGGGGGGGGNTSAKGIGGFGGGQSGGDLEHPSTGGGGAGMGGAIFNDAGSVTLTNVTFYENTA